MKMYKAIYGEDREWALGRIGDGRGGGGHGIRERNEWVMRVLKEWEFFPCFLMHDFFLLLFLCMNPFFPN